MPQLRCTNELWAALVGEGGSCPLCPQLCPQLPLQVLKYQWHAMLPLAFFPHALGSPSRCPHTAKILMLPM